MNKTLKHKACASERCPKGVLIASNNDYCDQCLFEANEAKEIKIDNEYYENLSAEVFTDEQIRVIEWMIKK